MDRNPTFGADQRFAENAKRVTDLLWETTGGNFSESPKSYLETLRYEFSDGRVSMLELIDRVDLGPDASYEDYCSVFDALVYTEASKWPDPDSIISIDTDALFAGLSFEPFDEFDYIEQDLSGQIETFLKKVISSVYISGVTNVTDKNGDPPNQNNRYLMSDDGETFSGIFYGPFGKQKTPKAFPFTISETKGKWSISY
jgi:hypothetical protein